MTKSSIGVIGMAVMGRNFALNIADKGFTVSVYNRTTSRMEEAVEVAKQNSLGDKFIGYKELKDFVSSLEEPRRIVILVQAGKGTEDTIEQLLPLLNPFDIIIDAGNEHYRNSTSRILHCGQKNVIFIPMGISGGEEGARHGPALMPGGDIDGWKSLKPILEAVAAKAPEDGKPCVDYIGEGAGGIYSKMVHNGIEYGDMQLIGEVYHLLKYICGKNNDQMAKQFEDWQKSDLRSYLIEITSKILRKTDTQSPTGDLIDVISDVAGSKGTGKWTCQEAADRGIPIPTIQAALDSRYLSGLRQTRDNMQKVYSEKLDTANQTLSSDDIASALYVSKICSYAQGLALLKRASDEEGFKVSIPKVASVWRGGCIIQAELLGIITTAFERNPELENLLLAPELQTKIKEKLPALRKCVSVAVVCGLAVPAMSASLSYIDALRSKDLCTRLTQAQRDFFGAHTFERIDAPIGQKFHADWI